MATKFTEKQQEVIRHRDGGLLVSAAAGSGKTTVMVEQIVELLLDPEADVSVEELLVVTFTKAAAASMKEKLEERLSRALEEDETNERIAEQIRLIPLASVMTNHAFSLQLVKEYITRIEGIDPGFRVGDETEVALMKADVLQGVLEELYSKALAEDPDEEIKDFMAFVNAYGGARQDKNLEAMVLDVYEYMNSDPEPQEWLDKAILTLDPDYMGKGSLYEIGELEEEDEHRKDLIRTYLMPAMRGLKVLLTAFDAAFKKEKADKNLLEFEDFEHNALTLLKDESIASVLRDKYKYIFVDEYQDCNRLQETILQRIARKNDQGDALNVFMVGDVKQSIYRFRLADPSLFAEKYRRFPEAEDMHLISLNRNFRSGVEVIDSVNVIFEALMREEIGGIGYGEDEKLYAADFRLEQEREGFTTRLIVENVKGRQKQVRAEAMRTAREIRALVDSGEWHYKDMVILMRSAKASARDYAEVFEQMEIPLVCETNESFYDALEVRTMMNLLSVIDNPHQDIPLMGVLYSPIVAMSDEDLGRVRLARRDGDFYDALMAYKELGKEQETLEKVSRFLDQLSNWREKAKRRTIHDLLWELYLETGYYLYASAMVGGEVRKANLDLLLSRSVNFEKGSYSGLYQFLRYVEKMGEDTAFEKESSVGSDKDAVRIMTIHKSKGLEFPVVFVNGLGKGWNKMDLNGAMVLHDKMGIGVDLKDPGKYVKFKEVKKEAIKSTLIKEMIAEEIRLLYVAMTRAKERLFLIGSRDGDPKELEMDQTGKLTVDAILSSGNFLSWVENIVMQKRPDCFLYEVEAAEGEEEALFTITPDREDLDLDEDLIKDLEEGERQRWKEVLLWEYPHLWKSSIPQVFSVSAIKHERMEEAAKEIQEAADVAILDVIPEETIAPEEKTASGKENIGARRGTAYHEIMARSDMSKLGERASMREEVARLVVEGYLTQEDADLVPERWILNFGKSDLCQRVLRSSHVVKEQAFILDLPLKELHQLSSRHPDKEDGSVILQGIIDLYFYEGDEIILADYKTDYLLDEATVAGYGVQLEIYAKALEDATGKKVKEKFLYAVREGKEIHC